MTTTLRTPRTTTGLASLAAVLLLTSCAGDPSVREDATTSPAAASSSPAPASPGPEEEQTDCESTAVPTRHTLAAAGRTIRATLSAPDRFRPDGAVPGRLHFLPMNVVTDSKAERWGDLFVYAPTKVHDPVSQKLVPLPDDLVGWLETNPGVRVVSTRDHRFGSVLAREVNVERDGSMLFAGDEPGGGPGGLERYVLWRLDGVWLVGQASTFRGMAGIKAPSARDDVFMSLLRSVRVTDRA